MEYKEPSKLSQTMENVIKQYKAYKVGREIGLVELKNTED